MTKYLLHQLLTQQIQYGRAGWPDRPTLGQNGRSIDLEINWYAEMAGQATEAPGRVSHQPTSNPPCPASVGHKRGDDDVRWNWYYSQIWCLLTSAPCRTKPSLLAYGSESIDASKSRWHPLALWAGASPELDWHRLSQSEADSGASQRPTHNTLPEQSQKKTKTLILKAINSVINYI